MNTKYINPYTDFGFKKLFGEEGSKELLVDFLNQLLPAYHQINELHFKNSEKINDTPSGVRLFLGTGLQLFTEAVYVEI